MPDLMHDASAARHPETREDPARQQAIRQIERQRRYRISATASGLGMALGVSERACCCPARPVAPTTATGIRDDICFF